MKLIGINSIQLPRAASYSRTSSLRVPNNSFRRWNSTETEKVKGQVIGIDLGKQRNNTVLEESIGLTLILKVLPTLLLL